MSSQPVAKVELQERLDEVSQSIDKAVRAWHAKSETPSSFLDSAQNFLDDTQDIDSRDFVILRALIDNDIAPKVTDNSDLNKIDEVKRKFGEYRRVVDGRIIYHTRRPPPAEPVARPQPVRSTTAHEPQKRRFMGGLISLAAAIGIAGASYLMYRNAADNSEKNTDKPAVIESALIEENSLPEIRYNPKAEAMTTPVTVPKVEPTPAVSEINAPTTKNTEIAIQTEARKPAGYKIALNEDILSNRKGLWGIAQKIGADPVKFARMYADHHKLGEDTDTLRVVNGVVVKGSDGLRADVVTLDAIAGTEFTVKELTAAGITTEDIDRYVSSNRFLPVYGELRTPAITRTSKNAKPVSAPVMRVVNPKPIQIEFPVLPNVAAPAQPEKPSEAETESKTDDTKSPENKIDIKVEPAKPTPEPIDDPKPTTKTKIGSYGSEDAKVSKIDDYRNKTDIQAVAGKIGASSENTKFNPIYMSRVMRSFTEMCDKTGDIEKAVNYVAMAEQLSEDNVYAMFEITNKRIENIIRTRSGTDAARTVGMQLGVSAANAQGAYENLSEALMIRKEKNISHAPLARAA